MRLGHRTLCSNHVARSVSKFFLEKIWALEEKAQCARVRCFGQHGLLWNTQTFKARGEDTTVDRGVVRRDALTGQKCEPGDRSERMVSEEPRKG